MIKHIARAIAVAASVIVTASHGGYPYQNLDHPSETDSREQKEYSTGTSQGSAGTYTCPSGTYLLHAWMEGGQMRGYCEQITMEDLDRDCSRPGFPTCPPPPPSDRPCPSQSVAWRVGANNCTGSVPASEHQASATATDNAGSTTGSATYVCQNETWALQPGASCDSDNSGGTSNPPAPYIANFTVSPSTAAAGQQVTFSWSSSNTNSCTASGDFSGWSGNKAASGSEAQFASSPGTYSVTLTCISSTQSDSRTRTLTVNAF